MHASKYRPFEDARQFARSLELTSFKEWLDFCAGRIPEKGTRPPDIPSNPDQIFAGRGWMGYGDWLGTGRVATSRRKFRPFDEAREFVRSLKLKGQAEWMLYCQGKVPHKGTRPPDIPACPRQMYEGQGWKGFGDWLGTGTIAASQREFRPFREARSFARGLKLSGVSEWRLYCDGKLDEKGKLPFDVPKAPQAVYASRGWKGYGDWLGVER